MAKQINARRNTSEVFRKAHDILTTTHSVKTAQALSLRCRLIAQAGKTFYMSKKNARKSTVRIAFVYANFVILMKKNSENPILNRAFSMV